MRTLFRTLPAPLRFAVALAAVGAVFVVDRSSGSVIDDGSLFLLLATAVMASAWFAGTGPALAATVTGALVGAWQPGAAGNVQATGTHLALFVVQGLLLDGAGFRAAPRPQGRRTAGLRGTGWRGAKRSRLAA